MDSSSRPLVALESPYAGDVARNITYALKAFTHSLTKLNEYPIASHLLYPQVLNDLDPDERALGIAAGLAWALKCNYAVFYIDYGYSAGMQAARDFYEIRGLRMYERRINV